MPLEPGKSSEAFSQNVKTEMEHGRPQKQAVAIAYREGGENRDNEPLSTPAGLTVAEMVAKGRAIYESGIPEFDKPIDYQTVDEAKPRK
jgi:hypothetical protein